MCGYEGGKGVRLDSNPSHPDPHHREMRKRDFISRKTADIRSANPARRFMYNINRKNYT